MAVDTTAQSGVTNRRSVFAALLGVLVVVAVEGSAGLALLVLERTKGLTFETVPVQELLPKHREEIARLVAGEQATLVHDGELGWTLRPGAQTEHFRIDSFGVRVDESFARPKPAEVRRIVACGDSFTFGADVVTPFTFEEGLMRRLPGVEVVNLGVPAYGPEQAWLRCRRLMAQWQPDVVLIGFLADDAGRAVNTFRPFFFFKSGLALGKPRFVLRRDGALELVPNPLPTIDAYRELLAEPARVLPRLGEHDYHFHTQLRPSPLDRSATVRLVRLAQSRLFPVEPMWDGDVLNANAEPLLVSAAVLSAFSHEVTAAGATPLVTLFASRFDISAEREGRPTAYVHLRERLESQGVDLVDLVEGFSTLAEDVPVGKLARVHYTRRGNAVVAEWLTAALAERGLVPYPSQAAAVNTLARLERQPGFLELSEAERAELRAEIPGALATRSAVP